MRPTQNKNNMVNTQKNKSIVSHGFAAELIKSSGPIIIRTGETIEAWAEFKNIGSKPWNANTRLGTMNPRDHKSIFSDKWPSKERATSAEIQVLPGEIYTFYLKITAPQNFIGTMTETFGLVQEGVTWFDNPHGRVSFEITSVTNVNAIVEKNNRLCNDIKILYLSCHESLEYDDVSNLRALGFDVFVVGHNTYTTTDQTFRKLTSNNEQLQEYFDKYFRENFKPGLQIKLNAEFVDNFDIVITSHYSENITFNWEYIKNKICIYRSIASCNATHEAFYSNYKNKGLKIIRLSPAEAKIPGYLGSNAIIRASIDPDYYKQWTGQNLNILTIQKMINISPSRMQKEYEQVTDIFKEQRILCGKYNDIIPYAKNNVSENELVNLRSNCRVYLALCSKQAPLVMTFAEAMMAGMPVVTFGKKIIGYDWFEQSDFIENGINGFYGNSISEIQNYIRILLSDYDWAKSISIKARETANKHFNPEVAKDKWKTFFKEYYNIITL